MTRRRGRPPRPSPQLVRLADAVRAGGGDAAALLQALQGMGGDLGRRLARLRAEGAARTVVLYDPRRLGRPCELGVRVKLRDYARATMTAFEARLGADPAVTNGVFVAGPHDYELRAFLADDRAVRQWVRDLEADPAVRWVRAARLRTILGDDLPGLRLGRV